MSGPGRGLVALSLSALSLTALSPSAGAAAEPKGRDITYRVTSGGLLIDVEGVELSPKAEAVKTSKGWIVSLSVRATVRDQHAHRLLSPENGPLMVAADVVGRGATAHTGDDRKGDGEQALTADDATTIARKVDVPITAGQSLTLHVGLWGLGRDDEERRPVKKLFVVKMVAGAAKPQPVVTPPQ